MPDSVLSTLITWFAKDIYIHATPTEVSFRRGEAVLVLRPILTMSEEAEPKVVAVGLQISSAEPTVEIDLFDPLSTGTLPKHSSLEAFFRYAFHVLAKSRFQIRPRVFVEVSKELSTALCGYEHAVIASACTTAGARECIVRAEGHGS